MGSGRCPPGRGSPRRAARRAARARRSARRHPSRTPRPVGGQAGSSCGMVSKVGGGTLAPRMRALVVTNMYPSPQRPELGSFVRDQVEALRRIDGVQVELFAFAPGGAGAY